MPAAIPVSVQTDLQSDLQATLGAGFRVTRELAGGGMSRVFLAEESLLQREVVVKLLPPELMAGLSVERFRSEIQHAARLQHPHIVPVLSAGVIEYSGGTRGLYYTMPFIRGETLRARLERDGRLSAEEVRRILLDVADALAHAHDQGIVHRDIKPDNIFLSGKSAMVADFGVSKALHREGTEGPVTGVGVTLGTPGYMAPEQASGEQDLDQRADIYAAGVLAYELLTGRRPFEGTSIQQLLIAQATRTPVPLLELRPETPPLLAAIVMRCLEKRPEDRYQNAHQLLAALETLPSGTYPVVTPVPGPARRRPGTRVTGIALGVIAAVALLLWRPWSRVAGASSAHVASVAVLPPEYFRPDTTVAATLADLVDHISNDLSRVEGLKVVNYMSVGALLRRGTAVPALKDMGAALGVDNFVLFVPGRTDRRNEVSVQLINASTQAQLWVTRYTPDSTNFNDIDDDVVSRVTHALLGAGARLPPEAHSARARREGAHGEYLAGQRALRRRTPDGVSEAVRLFENAIRLDSSHAEAIGRLATALALQLSYGYRTTLPSYPTAARALALAERAMRLEPDRGDPVAFRAYIEYLAFAPLVTVRADFERAIGMRPSEADVAGWHALMLLREGKTEPSLAESRRALELDPLSSARHLTYALAALGARRYAMAGLEAKRATEMEPTLRRARQVEALAMLLEDHGTQCVGMDLAPYAGVKAMCLRAAGREKESRATVDSLRRVAALDGETDAIYSDVLPAQELATYYAWVGNAAESLKYLRLAFSRSPVGIDQRIVQSGIFDRVRQAPGFAEELARMQDSAWPKVMEMRQRLDELDGGMPLAARTIEERRHGG